MTLVSQVWGLKTDTENITDPGFGKGLIHPALLDPDSFENIALKFFTLSTSLERDEEHLLT